jgi:hypothetical protein
LKIKKKKIGQCETPSSGENHKLLLYKITTES